jgi:hypothetical protein
VVLAIVGIAACESSFPLRAEPTKVIVSPRYRTPCLRWMELSMFPAPDTAFAAVCLAQRIGLS